MKRSLVVLACLLIASSAFAGGGPQLQYVSGKDCITLANPPAGVTQIGYNSFGNGYAWRKLGACYKPTKQKDGTIKVEATMMDEDDEKVAFAPGKFTMEAEFKKPGTVTTVTQTTTSVGPVISLDDQLAQCKTDLADWQQKYKLKSDALNECLKARVKSVSKRSWLKKSWCDTRGKKLGLVWKKAKNKYGGYCDCPGGKKDWDKSKNRCIAGGATTGDTALASTPVNLGNVIPRLDSLEKVVGQLVKDVEVLRKDVDALMKTPPGHDPVARKSAADADKKAEEALRKAHEALNRPAPSPPAAVAAGPAKRKSFFGPRVGGAGFFSPAGNRGYGILGGQLLHRSKDDMSELVVGLEIGTDFSTKPYFGLEVAVQFRVAERILIGFSGRYDTFGLTSHLGGEFGRGLTGNLRVVVRIMPFWDVVLTAGAGLRTQPVGWAWMVSAPRLHFEFNF